MTVAATGSTNNFGAFHVKQDSLGIQAWPTHSRSRQDKRMSRATSTWEVESVLDA